MIPKARVLVAAGISAMLLWPASALAQRARPARAPGRAVAGRAVVRGGVYYPYYYRPFIYPYYSPFYFGFGVYYDSLWGYPYYARYPYGGYPYPYAYPYPGYFSGSWASARIEVKPKQAQVYLDGYYVGIVDQFDGFFQRLDVPTGEHDLSIYMPGYHTLRERMLFRPGQTYHFKEAMQPLSAGEPQDPKPQPGPNAVPRTSRPPYPNAPYPNAPYPNAPYPNAPYPPPTPGPYRQPPPPPPGEPRMEPIPPGAPQNRGGEFGTLNLRVQPDDAVVIIDGQHWDNPQSGSRLTVQLAPGTHRIEVRKDGFRTYTGTVEIRPGEPQTLNISLPPGER